MTEIGDNLATVLSAWLTMARTGSTAELAGILDDGVIWQGLRPELVCHGRDEVLHLLAHNQPRTPRLTKIVAEEQGDRVLVTVVSPDFEDTDMLHADAPRSIAVTLRNGRVTRLDDVPA